MVSTRTGIAGIVVLAATMGASTTLGSITRDDVVPPPWERYQPFTTVQEWEFFDNGNIAPDGPLPTFNPNTTAFPNFPLLAKPGAGVLWDPGVARGSGVGLYIGSGNDDSYIDFCIPNWIDVEPLKLVWIQINGFWDATPAPFVQQIDAFKGADQLAGGFLDQQDVFPGQHRTELWGIQPNPDVEIIRIFLPEGSIIDQVVIDTISFPTPGAVSAFGLAGLALARRRR